MFEGLGTALITPFINGEGIDFNSLEKLLKFQEAGNVDYIVIAGTTGEAPTLTNNEILSLVDFTASKTKLKIVLGVSGNATNKVLENLKLYNLNKNISAYLVSNPYYNKPNQEGLYQHYSMIAKNANKPIILYNIPSRTGSRIDVETVIRLANDYKNIVAIKDAVGSFEYSMSLVKALNGESFTCLSGDDASILPLIALGYSGAISVVSNELPLQMKELIESCLKNDYKQARSIHYKYLDLININFIESNPIPAKYILSKMGYCDSSLRLPLYKTSKEEQINKVLKTIL